jgi:hypothetical protein
LFAPPSLSSLDFFSFAVETTGSSFLLISSVLIISSLVVGTVVDVVGNSTGVVVVDSVTSAIGRKIN